MVIDTTNEFEIRKIMLHAFSYVCVTKNTRLKGNYVFYYVNSVDLNQNSSRCRDPRLRLPTEHRHRYTQDVYHSSRSKVTGNLATASIELAVKRLPI